MSVREHSRTAGSPQRIGAHYDRRTFLTGLGCVGATLLLPEARALADAPADDVLLCVGSFGSGDAGTLHTLATERARCERLNSVPSERPVALVTHPLHPIVYVANDVKRYQHEPRGTIEAFLADLATGRLERLARQPLSLSAIQPRSMAISPDGRSLLVASFGGGAYNILPLDLSGMPGPPSTILKQMGRGPDSREQASSHPASVLFHPKDGWAIAADYGTERLDLLSREQDGAAENRFRVVNRFPCSSGSGPGALALHREGRLVAVSHALEPSLSILRMTPSGALSFLGKVELDSAPTAVSFHREKDVLYSTVRESSRFSRLDSWRINPATGALRRSSAASLPSANIASIYPASQKLWLTGDCGVAAASLDPLTATPDDVSLAAALPGAQSLAVIRKS